MSHDDNTESIDRRLHRLHDGDLSATERAALEEEIAKSPMLGKKLEGLREIGVVVRAARTDDQPIDSDILWAAIEGKIASATPGDVAKPALRAIDGGAPKTKTVPVEDPRVRRRRLIGIAVGAFAIAAAALLMVYGSPANEPDTVAGVTPPEATTPRAPGPDDATEDEVATATDYTEVLAVDFGDNVGTIFAVEGEGGQRYAVVWLDDVRKHDEGEPVEGAPSAPN